MKLGAKLVLLLSSMAVPGVAQAASVFSGGTIFVAPNLLTSQSASSFSGLTYAGIGERYMFDRRINDWVYGNVYLFNTTFSDGLTSEVNVNLEFGSVEAAQAKALYYSTSIGRLPSILRTDVDSIWIQDGVQPFGGGNNSILIHDGQGALYDRDNILEETFLHEATHTSLDGLLGQSAGWLEAERADPMFISPYAEQYPDREDMAETFPMWLAARYRPESLTSSQLSAIEAGIPNRLAFFDRQNFNLFPFFGAPVPEPTTWMMMIAGFGLIGGAMRRRRNVTVRLSYS